MITALFQKYLFIGGGVVVAVLLAVIGVQHIQNGGLKNDLAAEKLVVTQMTAERDEAVRVAGVNAAAVEAIKAERDQTQAVLDGVRAADAKRQEKINKITKEVSRAKKSECPAGDGLAAAHRGLRELTERKAGN